MRYDYERVAADALLYAKEGEDPTKALDNAVKREQAKAIRNGCLPKKANENGVPRDLLFKGIDDSMVYEQRSKIVYENACTYAKDIYESMGISIVGDYSDLLYSVHLPDGWEIKSNGMYWSDVIDDKGRKRMSFFYKGGLYDRDAFVNFNRRYNYEISPFDKYETDAGYQERKFKPWSLVITDGGNHIKKLDEITPTTDKEYFALDDNLRKQALDYLDKEYPDWRDIKAYWD